MKLKKIALSPLQLSELAPFVTCVIFYYFLSVHVFSSFLLSVKRTTIARIAQNFSTNSSKRARTLQANEGDQNLI